METKPERQRLAVGCVDRRLNPKFAGKQAIREADAGIGGPVGQGCGTILAQREFTGNKTGFVILPTADDAPGVSRREAMDSVPASVIRQRQLINTGFEGETAVAKAIREWK